MESESFEWLRFYDYPPEQVINIIVVWGARITMWWAVWIIISDVTVKYLISGNSNKQNGRILDPAYGEKLHEKLKELKAMEHARKLKKQTTMKQKLDSLFKNSDPDSPTPKSWHIRERLKEMAEKLGEKIQLESEGKKSANLSNNSQDEITALMKNLSEIHEKYNPYSSILKDSKTLLSEDFQKFRDVLVEEKIECFEDAARLILPAEDFEDLQSSLHHYQAYECSYHQFCKAIIPFLLDHQSFELLGWLQFLAPSYIDMIRYQAKLEHLRKKEPILCRNLPLFQDIRSLIYILGSPTADLEIKYSAVLNIIELFTGDSLTAKHQLVVQRGPVDSLMETCFVECKGIEMLMLLAPFHDGIYSSAKVIFKYLIAVANSQPQQSF
eukprot:Sdes_comp20881_c0_seq3m17886